jgi:hypothetical protein
MRTTITMMAGQRISMKNIEPMQMPSSKSVKKLRAGWIINVPLDIVEVPFSLLDVSFAVTDVLFDIPKVSVPSSEAVHAGLVIEGVGVSGPEAATTNSSPNAMAPVESVSVRKNCLPDTRNGSGIQMKEFEVMLPGSHQPCLKHRGGV